jgi:hypothetical protein
MNHRHILSADAQRALSALDTVKVLSTTGADGIPHISFKNSLHLREDGYIEYNEFIESSVTNKNMTFSIWFNKIIAIALLENNERSFLIKGKVIRAIISGREFRERYIAARKNDIDTDLSTVWVIEPISEIEDTLKKRRAEEENAHPLLKHLDLLVVGQDYAL